VLRCTEVSQQTVEMGANSVAPKNTPAPIIDKLNGALVAIMADPKVPSADDRHGQYRRLHFPGRICSADRRRRRKWAKVIKFADIKP